MEQWLDICAGMTKAYWSEIMLVMAAMVLILMIITLKTVRKNTKAIHCTKERTKEILMLLAREMRSERKGEPSLEQREENARDAASQKQEEEALFGSVLQEIFP